MDGLKGQGGAALAVESLKCLEKWASGNGAIACEIDLGFLMRASDKLPHPLRSLLARETLMAVHRPPTEGAVGSTAISVSLGVGSKLPLPLYTDVRLHIPMTHHKNRLDSWTRCSLG